MSFVDSLLDYRLKSLNTWNNNIDETIKLINYNKETLTELTCCCKQIINLPDMPNLEDLRCAFTRITNLPNMPNLERLYCHNTQITDLPDMPNLKILNCHNTQIINLPDMPNLTHLYCRNTQITSLPDMPNLMNLECDIISLENYKKMYKIGKTLLILASFQVIKNKSILSNFKGFNISRLVKKFL